MCSGARSRTAEQGDLVLAGDSAGGGLALAVARQLADEGGPEPRSLVLLSPWVDATMANPQVPALERADPMLSAPGLVVCGRAWAGELDPSDPRVSPLLGRLDGLPPMTVLVGTRELFLADCRDLRDRVVAAGGDISYTEHLGQNHCFPLFPIPEARTAMDLVVAGVGAGAAV